MEKMRSGYREKMQKVQDRFAQIGDLKKALAARTAAKTDPTVATINANVSEIASVQRIFTNTQKRMQEKLKQSLTQLARFYVTQLTAIKDKLTKDKRLDSAFAVDEEIQKFVAELGLRKIEDIRKPSSISSNPKKFKEGLVAYYPFNGNARDESGNRNDGEVNGATLTTDRHGKPPSAYSFDGKDDFIEVDDDPSLNFDSEMSIAFWISPDSFGQRNKEMAGIVAKMKKVNSEDTQFQRGYSVNHNFDHGRGQKISLEYRYISTNDKKHVCVTQSNVNLKGWNHWVVIYDKDKVDWYLNGQIDKALRDLNPGNMSTPEPLPIGRCQYWGPWGFLTYFDGSIDDIRIYKRALSALEIRSIYDSEKP